MRVNAARINRKAYTLSEFRGVDYSSSPLEVKPYRATDMANLLLRDGVLHKRHGWEQVAKLTENKNMKDIFLFNDKLVVYGDQWVGIYDFEGNLLGNNGVAQGGADKERAQAFANKGDLYVVAGGLIKIMGDGSGIYPIEKNVVDSNDIKNEKSVAYRNPYTPTTTINITAIYAEADLVTAYPRTKHESLNLLSSWRKNRLILEPPGRELIYKLDGVPYEPSLLDIGQASSGQGKQQYAPVLFIEKGNEKKVYTFTVKKGIDEATAKEYVYWSLETTDFYGDSAEIILGKYSTLEALDLLWPGDLEEQKEISSGTNRDIGILVYPAFFYPFEETNTLNYTTDITLTLAFVADDEIEKATETRKKDIVRSDKCFSHNKPVIGSVFGVDGANDRLFLAGSAEHSRNTVFYSKNDNFTYFPANQQLACGDTNAPITAIERLADGTLAVFKDVSSLREPSIYYITGKAVSVGSGLEGNEYYADLFSVSSGTISERGVSARSTINYDGDSLFASKNGVYAIVLSENAYTKQRYARERSRPIAAKLKEYDLSNAAAVVFDDMYWLSVADGSGEVFVADSKYKHSTEGTQTNSYNYEWFRLTNIPAVSFVERGDELYFLSHDGWLCRFHNGYTDIYNIAQNSGNLTVTTLEDGSRAVAFNVELLELIQAAAYAVDVNGVQWEIFNIRTLTIEGEEVYVFDLPEYAAAEDGAIGLKIHLPIKAYWKSAVLDLGGSLYKKNLWAISVSAMPTSQGKINVGYQTRRESVLEGINAFHFDDVDFSSFSFDCGGFVNAFRQKVFERGLIYMQMMYSSESVGDVVVNSLTVEYSATNKNIGIG